MAEWSKAHDWKSCRVQKPSRVRIPSFPKILPDREREPLPFVVGAAALLLYLARPSYFFNFDGVACAIAVDLGDVAHLAHGNHVLYGLVGLAFHKAWQLLGYRGQSIVTLQAMDSLLGGLGAALFCRLLLRLGCSRARAAACSAGLALSQAYWFWSLEAQVYPLGNVFALLAFSEAVEEEPRGARLGLWHGLAFLGHVGHAMLAPAILLALAGTRDPKRRAARWIGSAAVVALAGYAVGALCVRPADLGAARSWLLGSAALTLDRSVRWYGGYSPANLWEWLRMTPRIFAEPEGLSGTARALAWALGLAAVASVLRGIFASVADGKRRAAAAAVVWIAGYFLLFASWQPFTPVYRISDLFPLWLLIAYALTAAPAAALAAALGAFNLALTIVPKTDAARNMTLQESLLLAEAAPEDAWIVVTGLGQVYVPYFAHRRPLNTKYFEGRPDALYKRLDELAAAGEPVFVTSWTLSQANGAGWDEALKGYGLVEAGPGLFKARRTGSPKARAGKG